MFCYEKLEKSFLVAQFAKKIYLAGKFSKNQCFGTKTCKKCLQQQNAKNKVPAWEFAKKLLGATACTSTWAGTTINENWNSDPNPETHPNQTEQQCCIVRFAIRWQGATSVTVIQKVAGGEYQTDNGGSYEARHTWWQLFNEIQWKQSKKYKNKIQTNTKTETKTNATINDANIDNGESYEARQTIDSSSAMEYNGSNKRNTKTNYKQIQILMVPHILCHCIVMISMIKAHRCISTIQIWSHRWLDVRLSIALSLWSFRVAWWWPR